MKYKYWKEIYKYTPAQSPPTKDTKNNMNNKYWKEIHKYTPAPKIRDNI